MANPRPYSVVRALGSHVGQPPEVNPLGLLGDKRGYIYLGEVPNVPDYHVILASGQAYVVYCPQGFIEVDLEEARTLLAKDDQIRIFLYPDRDDD